MSLPENPPRLVQLLSLLCILWLAIWLLLLLLLPRDYYSAGFFLMGILPIAIWFSIQPRRIIWFLVLLFGISAQDD